MKFASRTFTFAGIYGILLLAPYYFMEGMISREMPPAITHPEFFYGFVGCALAWQFAFLVVGRDPLRYRPLMIPAVFEKLSFGVAGIVLYSQHRIDVTTLAFAGIDFLLGLLFIASFFRCRPEQA